MTPERRAEITAALLFFKNKPITNKVLEEFCKRRGFAPITEDMMEDYLYQVEYDRKMVALWPEMLAALAKLKYLSDFIPEKERETIVAANNDVQAELVVLFENNEILEEYSNVVFGNLSALVGGTIEAAKNRLNNAVNLGLRLLAAEKFGLSTPRTITIKQIGAYIREVAEKEKKSENK